MSNRPTVFVSHGNPQDNEIAGWLAARLAGAGYQVWIDLWHGKGHPTWEEIEEEIRVRSGRVIALVSKQGVLKPGFKDEINAAVGVGRQLRDTGFILPIRLDDISFHDEVPIQLARLNFIDGNGLGWDQILASLLDQLGKDQISRQQLPSTALYDTWLTRRRAAAELVSREKEPILSNWFKITSFPQSINFYTSSSLRASWDAAAQSLRIPNRYQDGVLCTFAAPQEVRMLLPLGIKLKHLMKVPTGKFLSGDSPSPLFVAREDSSRAMVDLIRQGFANLAGARGLQEHKLSNRVCWYPRRSLLGDQRIKFSSNGFSGSRQLVGRHKEFFWHYGTSIDVAWSPPARLTASGHVLFSLEGEKVLSDVKVAAKLRRKALRSKRNAWWRDVMLAYFSLLSSGEAVIALPMGGDEALVIDGWPIEFMSPRRLEFDAGTSGADDDPIDAEISDEVDDLFDVEELADGDDDEPEEQ